MATAQLTPKQEAFKNELLKIQATTEDELCDAVERLPCEIRERLAEGPLKRRWSCAVCEAFGSHYYKTAAPESDDDPRWLVWAYHEIPKVEMSHRDQLHYGPLANETYRRCLATYRAAGWDGDAGEPNA